MTRKTSRTVKNKNELDSSRVKKVKEKKISQRQILLQPKSGTWEGLPYESLLELSFIQWCLYLKKEGFVKEVTRSGSYALTESVRNTYKDEKGKSRSETLLRSAGYEPDFVVTWSAGWEAFVWDGDSGTKKNRELVGRKNEVGDMVTVIEIKPIMDRNQSIRIAKDRIKFLFANQGVYVNLVQPELFYDTHFPPDEWRFTPTGLLKKKEFRTMFDYFKLPQK